MKTNIRKSAIKRIKKSGFRAKMKTAKGRLSLSKRRREKRSPLVG